MKRLFNFIAKPKRFSWLLAAIAAAVILAAAGAVVWKFFWPREVIKFVSLFPARQEALEKERHDLRQQAEDKTAAAETYLRLGEVEQLLGNLSAAERAYKKGLKKYKSDDRFYAGLGSVYGDMGRYVEADKMLRRATEMNPANPDGFLKLIDLYFNHFPGESEELKNIFLVAGDYTNDADIFGRYAEFLESRREFRESLIYWQEALRARPGHPEFQQGAERVSKILEGNK